ncbi:hypothetical protein B0H16DRAFT_1854665 [Mycena metata]|uniref:BTB domain-containing protein n=1 Tax=Mycena metata TaxID=1033252 RepID=A0AAD7IP32_9AGAR|nr:hypothetical protein B0H16DRAFT_1854665 [Mycena metata]
MSNDDSALQRPPKRLREDANFANPTPLTRSEIWMPYGDVVLQAQSTLFKVNRDILAKHSSVFQGLFLVPQSPNQEMMEGCPIVEVSDSASDIKLLLTALYDPLHNKAAQPFEVISVMLRLGRKYEILAFKNDALARMHTEFPASLSNWRSPLANQNLATIEDRAGLFTLEELFQGAQCGGGSRSDLPDSTKVVLALAKERIGELHKQYGEEMLGYRFQCGKHCVPRVFVAHSSIRGMIHEGSFLRGLEIFGPGPSATGLPCTDLCPHAKEAAKTKWGLIQSAAWKKLPGFFGLPDWEELKDFDSF